MYQRILVPLDGSTLSEAVLPHAEKLTRALNVEIVLLHVDVSPAPTFEPPTSPLAPPPEEVKITPADALSYGDQRRVEIARALATHPKFLLLDEPAAGMNDAETARLGELIINLSDEGLTVLVIEHDMPFIAQVCDHVVVLNFGEVIARGTVNEIKSNPLVVAAYLGAEEAADA